MNNGLLLKIEELRIENDKFVHKLCLINPAKIIAIQSGMLAKQGPQLIGEERERELRLITLEGNVRVFTETAIDKIADKIASSNAI